MKERNEVKRERLDTSDESIMMTLLEGSQTSKFISSLTDINYRTCRQRLKKLLKYGYVAKPGYGEYALTDKGRHFVEELTMPVSPDLKDPNLKKLIDLLPSELHRAFFRLLLSGVIAKYHLSDIYDDGYPAFILAGETKGFKTALANVACKLLGLKPEGCILPMFSAVAGEFGVRRFRAKEQKFAIAASPMFSQPFVCLDEYDKVTDRDTRRNVLFFLDGRRKFMVEGELVENRVCTMLTLNTKIGKEGIARFNIPEPYIRRSIVADTEHVRTELRDVDLVARRIFVLKNFPRINLSKLLIAHSKLPEYVFDRLSKLLLDCTQESFHRLVDTIPLVILTHGRMPLLDGDINKAMYQTILDRLVCLESIGGTVPGWREKVSREWAGDKREVCPEIEQQLRDAENQDKERKHKLAERKADLEEKKVEQIDAVIDFTNSRAEFKFQLKKQIRELGREEPLVESLEWLFKEVKSAKTQDQLEKYRKSFERDLLLKIDSRLKEKYEAQERKSQEKEKAQKEALLQKEFEREDKRKRNAKISELREILKRVKYYLRRKELCEGEDPVLTLQQLKVIIHMKGFLNPSLSREFVKGRWSDESGELKYIPPCCNFADHHYRRHNNAWIIERDYFFIHEVQTWTSWTNIRPLLEAKQIRLLDEINWLRSGENMDYIM